MNKTLGIMGCGWLGLPLASAFLADGYLVKGSTTSEAKEAHVRKLGIDPYIVRLTETQIEGDIHAFLQDVHTLVVNVPPGLRSKPSENYVLKMQLLVDALKTSLVKELIFVSSTSVYGAIEGDVTEDSPPNPTTASGKQVLAAESLFTSYHGLKTTIVRFGGLIGPSRHPVIKLSGKDELSDGDDPINLIHLDDCIRIIRQIVVEKWWDQLFNAVYPFHPSKKEYYALEAKKRALPAPIYRTQRATKGKIVHSSYLISVKNYHFMTSIVS